eukprot:3053394-Rhodomonas_salina.1
MRGTKIAMRGTGTAMRTKLDDPDVANLQLTTIRYLSTGLCVASAYAGCTIRYLGSGLRVG